MSADSSPEIEIAHGEMRAAVTTTGAALRALSCGGDPILWGTAPGDLVTDGRGQVLAPWPNRLEDGTYRFAEAEIRVPWSEPARQNAIHGLVRWLTWSVESQTSSKVRLSCPLAPQPAYPFTLGLTITYELDDFGMKVTADAVNAGSGALPFGIGFHPYFHPGPAGLNALQLEVPARRHLIADDRGLPVSDESLSTAPAWRPLGESVLDDCFTDLARDDAGCWRVRITPGDGARQVTVFGDAAFGYVMCFTADTLSTLNKRAGVAIEPMTCPPNALRSGTDLVVLEPGERFSATWGIEV
jgi:aldose 1-epimerase